VVERLNKIIYLGPGAFVEVHENGRLELHRRGRTEWASRYYICSFWPEAESQIDEALAELGSEES
jgi:hypothetical protein